MTTKQFNFLKKFSLLILIVFSIHSCKKDDDTILEPTEVRVNGRIIFSKNNDIPELLKVANFSGKTVIGNEDIQQPNDVNGFEFILDENDEILFLSRKYPNYTDNDISSKSTALFLATLNSTFRKLSVDQKGEVIEEIVSNQNFIEAVGILDSQENISIQNTGFLNKLALTTREVFSSLVVSRNSNQPNLPVTSSEFNGNNVKIKNISPFHVGIDVYKGNLLIQNELLDSDEELSYDLESENTEYTFVVRSGFLPLGQTVTEAALNAFEADYISLLDETIGMILGNAVDGNCLADTLSSIYSNVSFVAFYEDNNGNALNTFIDILTYAGDNFLSIIDSGCFNIDMGNFSEIFDFFTDLSFLQSANDYYEAAYIFPLYALYENNENICYTYVNNEIFVCDDSPVDPVFNPSPANNSINQSLNGSLSFTSGNNTPSNAIYNIYGGVTNPPSFISSSSSTNNTYSGITSNTTYYWKIETVSASGEVLATSPIWNFTTISDNVSTIFITNSLNFGSVEIGDSPTQNLIISNTGNESFNVSSISFSNSAYSIVGSQSGTVAANGGQLTLQVRFSPTQEQSYTGALTVNNNADNATGNSTVQLSGIGTTSTTNSSEISLSGNLDFGSVNIGDSPTRTLTISNTGNQNFSVSNINFPSNVYTSSWSSGVIPAQGNQEVIITFQPNTEQSYSGVVDVINDADNGSGQISISGSGNSTNSGNSDLSIQSITFDDEGNDEYDIDVSFINVGDEATPTNETINIEYFVNGNSVGVDTHSNMDPGEDRIEYLNDYEFPYLGNHTVEVVISQVSNEIVISNNTSSVTFNNDSGGNTNSIVPDDSCSLGPLMEVDTEYSVNLNVADYSLYTPTANESYQGNDIRGFWLEINVPSSWSGFHNIIVYDVSSDFDPVISLKPLCTNDFYLYQPNTSVQYANLFGDGVGEVFTFNANASNNFYIRVYHYNGNETPNISFKIKVE